MKTNRSARWFAKQRVILGWLIVAAIAPLEVWAACHWYGDLAAISTRPDCTAQVWNAGASLTDLMWAAR